MSLSLPTVPPRLSVDCQVATHVPSPVVTCGAMSCPESDAALVFNGAAALQVRPLFVERATKMSWSVPKVPPDADVHTATQFPAPSVAISGELSSPPSPMPSPVTTAGVVKGLRFADSNVRSSRISAEPTRSELCGKRRLRTIAPRRRTVPNRESRGPPANIRNQ